MKKVLITAAFIFLAAGISFAADHEQMHEMMMKQGGPKQDTRTELKIPEPMKVMHKGIMRSHLDAVSEITAALAANDLKKAAKISKEILGWNDSQEKMCSMFGESTGGKDFLSLGKAMHTKADDLANAAKAGKRGKALAELSELIKKCNACHEKYRH
ncbi:MAG: hypothetical protein A2Z89_03600 [Deltaproteobacteria bacterium GWA2_43_19]|nr:MAG: hypothetical protein A2Z89_03600 [Deltaproteobacteria bacterium GWA2_43_19]